MKKIYITGLLVITSIFFGCNEDFLNKLPKDEITPETSFATYENFTTYAWGLYDYFSGYGDAQKFPPTITQEFNSDNMARTRAGRMSDYAFQTKIVPPDGGHTRSRVTAEWDFSYIRRVNIMLDNIEQSAMSREDKDHWRSVGIFFRALRYYDLVAAFGDVPWIEHVLNDESEELFAPRTPRDEVAANILRDLKWAEEHIKADGDGANTINQDVVRALISRFGLFEGTWRKYHGLGDANTYLQASKVASEQLLTSYPGLIDNYNNVFNSEVLIGAPGIILCKEYVPTLTTNSVPRYIGSTSWDADLTKDAVESYLCTDGQPIGTSPKYEGDANMYDEFRNRDHRLYYTVVPPYKVKVGSPFSTWSHTGDPADAEYIELMDQLDGIGKTLPMQAWSSTMQDGRVINMSPHFRKFNGGQAQAVSQLGYFFWKFYNRTPLDTRNNSSHDAPIFRIGEVMLNYAEVMWELGEFTQGIADMTINRLRDRAHVAPMLISDIDPDFDPNRDITVDPLLWEIRRERRVELMGDGFRFNDLKRWKKGKYLNKHKLGVTVNNVDFNNKLTIHGGGSEGQVEYFSEPLGWLDHYYLEPLPTEDLALNKNLEQNDGYK